MTEIERTTRQVEGHDFLEVTGYEVHRGKQGQGKSLNDFI